MSRGHIMSSSFSIGIFIVLSTLASGFRSYAQTSSNLFSATPLGIGSCEFTASQICRFRVVALNENIGIRRVTDLRFKDFEICRGQEFQFVTSEMVNLKSHLLRLRDFSERDSSGQDFEIKGRSKRVLKEFLSHFSLIEGQLASSNLTLRELQRILLLSQELASAFRSNFIYPVDEDQNIPQALGSFLENHAQVIGIRPDSRACNLDTSSSSRFTFADDRSVQVLDPEFSTFWKRPEKVSQKNLAIGYDRRATIEFSRLSFSYLSPKVGYGINPGFNVKGSDGEEYKIRLGPEVRTGSFNSRMVHALGYPVLKIDYVKGFRTEFNLDLLREFNSRKSLGFNLTLFRQTLRRFELQEVNDPFEYIERAILKDGASLNSEELKRNLVLPGKSNQDLSKLDSYNLDFASNIHALIWKEVSVEKKEEDWEALGSWFYEGLNHENRRELRGFGVLAAWLGIYDIRWENTRLFVVKEKRFNQSFKTLKHVISDLGSGLGNSGGILTNSIAEVSDISKNFFYLLYGFFDLTGQVQPWSGQTDIYPTPVPRFIPIFTKYSSILPNLAFNRTDYEDTLWMAQYILQITPHQIRRAAEVSGFSQHETNIIIERLTARQSNLRQELYLEGATIR